MQHKLYRNRELKKSPVVPTYTFALSTNKTGNILCVGICKTVNTYCEKIWSKFLVNNKKQRLCIEK